MATERHRLRLYILGETPVSRRAIQNLKDICAEAGGEDSWEIEVVNLEEHPEALEEEDIVATPLLVKQLPPPMRRVIGDLSDREKVLAGLGLERL